MYSTYQVSSVSVIVWSRQLLWLIYDTNKPTMWQTGFRAWKVSKNKFDVLDLAIDIVKLHIAS